METYSTDTAHSVVNPSRAKSGLNDFEAAALPRNDIRYRNPYVIESEVSMAMWCIVIPENRHHAVDCDSGSSSGHNNNRLLSVLVGIIWICLAHDKVYFTCRIASAACPPFLYRCLVSIFPISPICTSSRLTYTTVQYIVVAFSSNAKLNVGCITRRDIWLRHQKR